VYLGVSGGDGVRNRLQHHGLAGLGRGDDKAALALADRGDQVDDPCGTGRVAVFETEPLVGVNGGQVVKARAAPGFGCREAVDGLDGEQGDVLAGSALSLGSLASLGFLASLGRLASLGCLAFLGSLGRLVLTGARGALDVVAGPQRVLADLGLGDGDIFGVAAIAAGPQESAAVSKGASLW
jgi:hypothetical protein